MKKENCKICNIIHRIVSIGIITFLICAAAKIIIKWKEKSSKKDTY